LPTDMRADGVRCSAGRASAQAWPLVLVVALGLGGCGQVESDPLVEAALALERGDRDAAISLFQKHLDEFPDSSQTRLRLAVLLRESNPDKALEVLGAIPRTDPHRIAAMQQTAILQLVAGRTAAAQAALEEVVAAQPDNFGAQLSLAELYFDAKLPQSALPHAMSASRLSPKRAQTYLLIADIYDELHDPQSMIAPLQSAIELEPEYYEARLNLAYAALRIGDLDTAKQQATWCHRRQPRDVSALRILASAARDEGQFADARTFLAKGLEIAPQDLDCRILEADLLLYERQPQAAYDRLKELYDAHKTTVRYLGALARAAATSGKREESRALYKAIDELLEATRKTTRSKPSGVPAGDAASPVAP
jgi:predicted Zn-dependent protease